MNDSESKSPGCIRHGHCPGVLLFRISGHYELLLPIFVRQNISELLLSVRPHLRYQLLSVINLGALPACLQPHELLGP